MVVIAAAPPPPTEQFPHPKPHRFLELTGQGARRQPSMDSYWEDLRRDGTWLPTSLVVQVRGSLEHGGNQGFDDSRKRTMAAH